MKYTGVVLLIINMCLVVYAQDNYAIAESSEGTELIIIREDKIISREKLPDFKLVQGDQIQTGKNTKLDLILYPNQIKINLSENTTFIIHEIEKPNESSFEVVYGRIRVKTNTETTGQSINVLSQLVKISIRNSDSDFDFGFDVLSEKVLPSGSKEPFSRIHCFDGQINIITSTSDNGNDKIGQFFPENYILVPGEMLTVVKNNLRITATESTIPDEVYMFWNITLLQEEEIYIPEPEKTEINSGSDKEFFNLSDYAIAQSTLRKKNRIILTGTIISSIGILVQGSSTYFHYVDRPDIGSKLMAAGTILCCISIPVFINGYMLNPEIPNR